MFWDPEYVLRQLLAAIPGPRRRRSWNGTIDSGTSVAAYGCCPICHDFVCISPQGRAVGSPCPNCGQLIRELDSLGSQGSTGVSDE